MKKTVLVGLVLTMSMFMSCRVFNPSVMLRANKDFQYDQFSSAGPDSSYLIAPNDILLVRVLSNNGENLISMTSNLNLQADQAQTTAQQDGISVQVEYDGTAKFPLIGRVDVKNKTRRQAEDLLESLYAHYRKEPYVTIRITNRKVIVFPGTGNNAQIVEFTGDNMNLLEALARVGGIANTGKAKKIKLIRGDLKNPKIYRINLSTLGGMKEADLALQAGDIIYVEPWEDPAVIFNRNIAPYLTIFTTIASVVTSVALIITLTK